MELITILGESIEKMNRKNWYTFLHIQKLLVEKHFDWLDLTINCKSKSLIGKGLLRIGNKKYNILLSYSPFHSHRYDRIYVDDKRIKYNNEIHLYGDLSLCLYHPVIDKPAFQIIPLFKMIPWISEWIIFYEQWRKYGVWLGKEIKH
jgi:hypothetical protein